MREIILYLTLLYSGDYQAIKTNIEKENFDIEWNLFEEWSNLFKNKYITFLDKKYPESLKISDRSPFTFFYYGNIDIINKFKLLKSNNQDKTILDTLNLKKLILFLEKDSNSAIVLEQDINDSKYLRNNKQINKIIVIYKYDKKLFDSVDNKTLLVSLFPIIEDENFSKAINTTKTKNLNETLLFKLCDAFLVLNSNNFNNKKESFKAINELNKNNKQTYYLNQFFSKNKEAKKNISNMEEIYKWEN